ncbi:hypothetical protein [uncultured Georgenia sp.]|uniref:hypothetical protein n=1 Tax=uncultured Georgenia sp. TaxID=378209 RepID=UPI002627CA4D|nr:hypothetical protein [uncultured Georgenia sp.]HLV05132.1 hypothetical protein [Actinomycetaceae bacterium]
MKTTKWATSHGVAEQLAEELADLESRIACLTRSRDTIRGFLAQTEHRLVLDGTG